MNRLIKMSFLSLLIMVSFSGCKKAEEHTAEIAKETITEIKENTLDAAKEAAIATEQAAKDIAAAADQAGTDKSSVEDTAKDK
ncbi:MAG: hypothetical protein WA123_01135 [Methylotenera sp.]